MADIGRNINGAFDLGFASCKSGVAREECPYSAKHMAAAWLAGWLNAARGNPKFEPCQSAGGLQ